SLLSTSLSLCFFLYSLAAHRHLHSFPTRRSSDLFAGIRTSMVVPRESHSAKYSGSVAISVTAWAWIPVAISASVSTPSFFMIPRSEEHTSELQSRENLVCRLLLEKKKQQKIQAKT